MKKNIVAFFGTTFVVVFLAHAVTFIPSHDHLASMNFVTALNPMESDLVEISENSGGVFNEGFSTNPDALPDSVKTFWSSTLMLFGTFEDDVSFGSGFVVGKKPVSNGTILTVLTSFHVVEKYCNQKGECPDLFVLNDIGFNKNSKRFFRAGPNVLRIHGVTLLKSSRTPDLALLAVLVQVEEADKISVLSSMGEAKVGHRIFAIGFPDLSVRKSSNIDSQHLIVKRWSSGEIQDINRQTQYGNLLIHSADFLPGESGSPLLDADGKVLGVNFQLLDAREDFDYHGGGCGTANTSRAALSAAQVVDFLKIIQ
jgi:S1-C subfamily serine protease